MPSAPASAFHAAAATAANTASDDPASGRMVEGGAEAEARQVLANIAAVLGDCGASLADVAKTTVFVTDMGEFAAVNAVYAEAFGTHRPARSTVQVSALPGGAQVEIETWAHPSP